MEDLKLNQEQNERVDLSNRTRRFLDSSDWLQLVKPIIDSMIKGVDSVRGIKKTDANTDIKAQALILAHQMTASYLEEIEIYLRGYVADGDVTMKVLEQKKNRESLYKTTK